MQPQLAGAHARLSVHVLGILNHVTGDHGTNRDSSTSNSLLRAIKLWYLMPALLHSPDGTIKKRQRFALVETGDIVLLLPWLMAFTRGRDSRPRDAALVASVEAKLERASSACRHAGSQSVSTQPSGRATINEETCNTLVAKFPSEDHAAVSAAVADAVMVRAIEGGDGNAPP